MHDYIEVKPISDKKGRVAFARKPIRKGTIIDVAYIIPIPNKEYKKICKTILYNYCYIWEDPNHSPEFTNAITLSISQFINHSYDPNVKYLYDYENKVMEFTATKHISKGEEITVNYNGLVDDKSPVWFEVSEDGALSHKNFHNDEEFIEFCKDNDIKIIPSIPLFDPEVFSKVLNNHLDIHNSSVPKQEGLLLETFVIWLD